MCLEQSLRLPKFLLEKPFCIPKTNIKGVYDEINYLTTYIVIILYIIFFQFTFVLVNLKN